MAFLCMAIDGAITLEALLVSLTNGTFAMEHERTSDEESSRRDPAYFCTKMRV
jgi:hypothetical protein